MFDPIGAVLRKQLVLLGVCLAVMPLHGESLLALRIYRILVTVFVVDDSSHLVGVANRVLILVLIVEFLLVMWRHFLIILRVWVQVAEQLVLLLDVLGSQLNAHLVFPAWVRELFGRLQSFQELDYDIFALLSSHSLRIQEGNVAIRYV